MPKTYTFTEARQNFTQVLSEAEREGEVRITHRSGKIFVIRPVKSGRSPLDVRGVDSGLTLQEINQVIREGRERDR